MDILIILSLALAIDLVSGEPPRVIHPVVWMGKVTSLWERGGIGQRPLAQFIYGTGMALVTIGLFTIPAYFILLNLKGIIYVAYVIVWSVLLKFTFSLRDLRRSPFSINRRLLK